MKKTLIITAAAAIGLAASAQNLSTEVVVERTIRPTERAATRPVSIVPTITLPGVDPVTLRTAGYSNLSDITRGFTRLRPADGAVMPERGPWRGYVEGGYFPVAFGGLSAGYRVLDKDNMCLGVWGQFNYDSYKPQKDFDEKNNLLGVRIGANYDWEVNAVSRLSADMAYTYGNSKTPLRTSQSYNDFRLQADWESAVQGLDYHIGAKVSVDNYGDITRFAFDDARPKPVTEQTFDGLKEQLYTLDAGASLAVGESSKVGLDLAIDYLHTSSPWVSRNEEWSNSTSFFFNPYYAVSAGQVDFRAGINIDCVADGKFSVEQVSPDVRFAWTPLSQLSIVASATGGKKYNTYNALRDFTPFVAGIHSYEASFIPVDATLDINIGPFNGFNVRLSGGYASAKDWLMAAGTDVESIFSVEDVKGFHGGITAAYNHRIFDVEASTHFADNGQHGYYMWRDRAKAVIAAAARVRPVKGLEAGLTLECRLDRKVGDYINDPDKNNVIDLGLHATYNFTPAFGVFADVNNLLCRREVIAHGITSPTIHGLVGVSLKF